MRRGFRPELETAMDRRGFITTGVGALAYAALADDKPTFEIVDTHTHFYDPTRPEGVPWPGKDDKALYRPVLPDEYKKLAAPLGVVGIVVVEASPWVDDNKWLLNLAAKEPSLLGVVGHLDPAADDFDKNLRRFAGDPLYRGIRISHGDLKSGLKAKLVDRCKLVVDHDLTLDVNGGPDMPADVARLAAKNPKLRIVINHCANLKIDGREPPEPWRDGMRDAAKHPNVYCKVSALVEQTDRKESPREADYYRPVIEVLWEAFGEDRLVFGSNWPVSDRAAPLSTVIAIVRDYFAGKGDRAAAKFFAGNSKAAYAWRKR
jgi:L-fuconolactonase